MAVVGEATDEAGRLEHSLLNRRADEDGAERNVATRESLRGRDEVGCEVPMLGCEPRSGATVRSDDFVEDQQDAVLRESRDARPVSSGGATMPAIPITGSAIIAAIRSAPISAIVASSSATQVSVQESMR